jgi:hypothetical protein
MEVFTSALVVASTMIVHSIWSDSEAESKRKTLSSARLVLQLFGDATVPDFAITHAVAGTLCKLACEVLIRELAQTRSMSAQWGGAMTNEEAGLRSLINGGISTMSALGGSNPYISE